MLLKYYNPMINFNEYIFDLALTFSKMKTSGVPIVAQWKLIRLVSMRTRVQSLASLSGLGIWHCHELWCMSQIWLQFDP